MEFVKLLNYNLNQKDIVKYFIFFFAIYLLIFKLDKIFTYRQIFVLIITSILTYIYIKNTVRNDFNNFKQIHKITNKLNINNYKYIQNEFEILNSLYKLLYLRTINSTCYRNSIMNIEKFLKNFESCSLSFLISSGVVHPTSRITLADSSDMDIT